MEGVVVVLYNGALTHYTVVEREHGMYVAGLLKYAGNQALMPPGNFSFMRQGRHCYGDIDDQDLLDDLYYALKTQQQKMNGPVYPGNNPERPYVNI